MLKVDLIAAARPNFMKIAPLYRAMTAQPGAFAVRLVHTGQHYDANMSEWFFRDLGLPDPDVNLEIGSGTHAEQTGGVMIAYEKLCLKSPPDWCIVVGDVNSTVACTFAAKKLGIRVAHLEAGLRSHDRTMPEELNRVTTDAIADLLWTPSPDGDENLLREGIPSERICRVGNIMIDSLEMMRASIESKNYRRNFDLSLRRFGVVTLHRPSNVDSPEKLRTLATEILKVAKHTPIVFPVHPRTRKRLAEIGAMERIQESSGTHLLDPLSYIDFMSLVLDCKFVLTDSGGIQEETTYLGIPCLTLRENTERPITVSEGTNRLISAQAIQLSVQAVLEGKWPQGKRPELWDGRTAARVVESLKRQVLARP